MLIKLEHIAHILRQTREQKGLSQSALGAKVGLTQSHISNIEKSAVDLKTTNLIELARALELEVMLVPRNLVSTVKSLSAAQQAKHDETQAPPAYRIDKEQDNDD